jgi:dolichol-phosphate mannosyltransferase
MEMLTFHYEILFIDDGSTDLSRDVIKTLASTHRQIKYLGFEKNRGQSAALAHGFQEAAGNVIITMDADGQNDPADLLHMFEYFGEYDMITGWRRKRQDSLSKKISSRIGNGFRNLLTNEKIHDTGCSLKIMRADMLKRVRLYKGMHRFLPTLMRLEGARVKEIEVHHRPRLHGVSKYTNLRRGIEGFHDVLAVRRMIRRALKGSDNGRHDQD